MNNQIEHNILRYWRM